MSETKYIETEALLKCLEAEDEECLDELRKLLPGELARLAISAKKLARFCDSLYDEFQEKPQG
jgi:mevalonate kinase